MNWTMTQMDALWRVCTGQKSTDQISQSNVWAELNDYYVHKLPPLLGVGEVRTLLQQAISPTDTGDYTISANIVEVKKPIRINGQDVALYGDKEQFGLAYPEDESYITAPGLQIGTASAAAVKNNSFYYEISDQVYHQAASETALSGSTVPQNKYGAWLVEIDASGTITITGASSNATGYATPGLAIAELPAENADRACLGYVTAINTAAGGFVPGATLLSAATVTDTYTDGRPSLREQPAAVLHYGRTLSVRPRADDNALLTAEVIQKPSELTLSTDTPLNPEWGRLIVYGSALEYMIPRKLLGPDNNLPALYQAELVICQRPELLRLLNSRKVQRGF